MNSKIRDLNGHTVKDGLNILTVCLCVTAVLFILWTFTGHWPWVPQPYNSYILQAQSWLEGRLDLGQNYPYLELAIFNNKYYVSFPPFPSYIMLPFVLIGYDSCDSMIAFVTSLLGAVYAYKILKHFNLKDSTSILFTLLLTVGSNWLLTAQNAWVWFIAQNMAFTLSLMAIYYALKNKAGLSLAFWACAVGCRPFQALYIPILCYLIYYAHKTENPNDNFIVMIKKRWKCLIPMAVIALSYMILNFVRFGSIIEFGHNYLPEHTRSALGQFHYSYIPGNLKSTFSVPPSENGIWKYPFMDGTALYIVSPIVISYILYIVRYIIKKEKTYLPLTLMTFILAAIHILALCAHVRLGGAHFGNRYMNDILPFVFLNLAYLLPKEDKWVKLNSVLLLGGLTVNVIGSILYYLRLY